MYLYIKYVLVVKGQGGNKNGVTKYVPPPFLYGTYVYYFEVLDYTSIIIVYTSTYDMYVGVLANPSSLSENDRMSSTFCHKSETAITAVWFYTAIGSININNTIKEYLV